MLRQSGKHVLLGVDQVCLGALLTLVAMCGSDWRLLFTDSQLGQACKGRVVFDLGTGCLPLLSVKGSCRHSLYSRTITLQPQNGTVT